jgi:SAM-dependent methyltransferase
LAYYYHALQKWQHWLNHHFLGQALLQAETEQLSQMLTYHFGKHALLIGVAEQNCLLQSTVIPCKSILAPPMHQNRGKQVSIEADLFALPITTGSVDLVLLPHTLEFIANPRQVLLEACRIIKPEGLIAICGFNPYSTWGLAKLLARSNQAPWMGSFIKPGQIKNWLGLADFVMDMQTKILYHPPLNYPRLYKRNSVIDYFLKHCLPFSGGVYLLVARAKVIPLTPIKLKWTQQFSGLSVSPTISNNVAQAKK